MNQFFYQITRKASELINSNDYRKRYIITQTAFTGNRKLTFPVMIILPDAFKELFLMTRDMVLSKNKIKCHKGYHILTIDGSEL